MMTDAVNQILSGLDQGLVSQGDVEKSNVLIVK